MMAQRPKYEGNINIELVKENPEHFCDSGQWKTLKTKSQRHKSYGKTG